MMLSELAIDLWMPLGLTAVVAAVGLTCGWILATMVDGYLRRC